MALSKSIEGRGGASASYHRITNVVVTPDTVSWQLKGYLSADERNGQGRTLLGRNYSRPATQDDIDNGVTYGSLYTEIKATDEFSGATNV